jgi:hypothetical protein
MRIAATLGAAGARTQNAGGTLWAVGARLRIKCSGHASLLQRLSARKQFVARVKPLTRLFLAFSLPDSNLAQPPLSVAVRAPSVWGRRRQPTTR